MGKHKRIGFVAIIAVHVLGLMVCFWNPSFAVNTPDEQFDPTLSWQNAHPNWKQPSVQNSDDNFAFWFSDFGNQAIASSISLMHTDSNQSGVCNSVQECSSSSDFNYFAFLPLCNPNMSNNCIESISAQQDKISSDFELDTNLFPNATSRAFLGDDSLKIPSGYSPSVGKFPGLNSESNSKLFAVGVYIFQKIHREIICRV